MIDPVVVPTKSERKRAEELAMKLGTGIPSGITLHLWSLPILEAMLKRIEALEEKVEQK